MDDNTQCMTPHTRALLLRLAACEIDNETHSIVALRRVLRDRGLDDAQIARAVARIRQTVEASDGR